MGLSEESWRGTWPTSLDTTFIWLLIGSLIRLSDVICAGSHGGHIQLTMLTLPTTTGPNETTTTGHNNTLYPPVDLAAFLDGLSPQLHLSEHIARFTGAGLDIPSLHAIGHWTRPEASDALTRPGLSPFQAIALEHMLRRQAINAHDDNLQSTATLAEFLAHPMPGVALTHHLKLFVERGVPSLADVRMLPDREDWVGTLKTLFGAGDTSDGFTEFELIVLEKGICRLWGS
ncbi:hypothetical protein C8F01DRAFT_1085759 [Mycena amicta]|nr:hypothetical protein C8F01DRAFT_1085759 [Mycena amicta]